MARSYGRAADFRLLQKGNGCLLFGRQDAMQCEWVDVFDGFAVADGSTMRAYANVRSATLPACVRAS